MVLSIVKNISIPSLLRVTRSYNLLIILLTQYLVFIYFINNGKWQIAHILRLDFFVLSISTIAIAAAGYIINDYHDVKIDMVNKPERVVVGKSINRRFALLIYTLLSAAGILLGFLLSWKIGLINLFSVGLLWLYSVKFKKIAFWGNLSIALLTALSILVIYIWKPVQSGVPLLAYAWFAFIITLIREIIKDMEDIKGDKMYGCKTLPIVYGIPGTARVLYFLIFLMTATLLAAFIYTDEVILKVFAILILIQVSYLSFLIRNTDTIKGFRRLGRFCKLIMISGIMALLFF